MENNNQNIKSSRFIYTDDDMAGLIILKHDDANETLEAVLKRISERSDADLNDAFRKAAEMLIQHSILIAGQAKYQIKEIEFYCTNEAHKDPYVHSEQYKNVHRQSEFGEWYFHRFLTLERYAHNRRGLDLTFGNKVVNNSGGILIRGIKCLAGGPPIQGPSNVVGAILSQLKDFKSEYSIDDLANGTKAFVFNANSPLRIAPSAPPVSKLLNCKRSGLSTKVEDEDGKYLNAHYRYFDEEYLMQIKGKDIIFRELVGRGIYDAHDAKLKIGYNINKW